MGKQALVELGSGWKVAMIDGRVFTWFEADLFLADDEPEGERQPHRLPVPTGQRALPLDAA